MIIDKIIDIFFYLPLLLLKSLPDIDFAIPDNVCNIINGFGNFYANVAYVIPVLQLMPIITTSLTISFLQIIWALILRIKSFIPTMGA